MSDNDLEDMFVGEVLLEDDGEVGRQVHSQACLRIHDHAELLDAEVEAATFDANDKSEANQASLPLADSLLGIEKGWILSKAIKYLWVLNREKVKEIHILLHRQS